MKLFEGKSPAEKNKIIAAIVLGVMAVSALTYTFGGSFIGGSRKVNVTVSASPTPTGSPRPNSSIVAALPNDAELILEYTTTPVLYNPGSFYAPDAGRNIFAFYEPPPPTPYVPPTPTPPKPEVFVPQPTPIPPPLLVGFVTPQSVYAGSKSFRMEVNGDKFTPDSLIYLNDTQLPTTFVSPQQLVAEVPSNLISGAGSMFVIVRTPDGGLYSNQVSLNVQAPPVPQFQYIGMIARQRFNNDTAYFQEQGKPLPMGARLNDVIGGRFRLISISAKETIFEDVNLAFKHRLALVRPPAGQSTGGSNPNPNPNNEDSRRNGRNNDQISPNTLTPVYITPSGDFPPGIPNNIPVYVPPPTPIPPSKRDQMDDEDGNR